MWPAGFQPQVAVVLWQVPSLALDLAEENRWLTPTWPKTAFGQVVSVGLRQNRSTPLLY